MLREKIRLARQRRAVRFTDQQTWESPEAGFHASIMEAPHDAARWNAYSDWLTEQGHDEAARGAQIAAGHASHGRLRTVYSLTHNDPQGPPPPTPGHDWVPWHPSDTHLIGYRSMGSPRQRKSLVLATPESLAEAQAAQKAGHISEIRQQIAVPDDTYKFAEPSEVNHLWNTHPQAFFKSRGQDWSEGVRGLVHHTTMLSSDHPKTIATELSQLHAAKPKSLLTRLRNRLRLQREGHAVHNVRGGEEESAFRRGMMANPHDIAPRLVYADWLQEHGDDVSDREASAHREIAGLIQGGQTHPIVHAQSLIDHPNPAQQRRGWDIAGTHFKDMGYHALGDAVLHNTQQADPSFDPFANHAETLGGIVANGSGWPTQATNVFLHRDQAGQHHATIEPIQSNKTLDRTRHVFAIQPHQAAGIADNLIGSYQRMAEQYPETTYYPSQVAQLKAFAAQSRQHAATQQPQHMAQFATPIRLANEPAEHLQSFMGFLQQMVNVVHRPSDPYAWQTAQYLASLLNSPAAEKAAKSGDVNQIILTLHQHGVDPHNPNDPVTKQATSQRSASAQPQVTKTTWNAPEGSPYKAPPSPGQTSSSAPNSPPTATGTDVAQPNRIQVPSGPQSQQPTATGLRDRLKQAIGDRRAQTPKPLGLTISPERVPKTLSIAEHAPVPHTTPALTTAPPSPTTHTHQAIEDAPTALRVAQHDPAVDATPLTPKPVPPVVQSPGTAPIDRMINKLPPQRPLNAASDQRPPHTPLYNPVTKEPLPRAKLLSKRDRLRQAIRMAQQGPDAPLPPTVAALLARPSNYNPKIHQLSPAETADDVRVGDSSLPYVIGMHGMYYHAKPWQKYRQYLVHLTPHDSTQSPVSHVLNQDEAKQLWHEIAPLTQPEPQREKHYSPQGTAYRRGLLEAWLEQPSQRRGPFDADIAHDVPDTEPGVEMTQINRAQPVKQPTELDKFRQWWKAQQTPPQQPDIEETPTNRDSAAPHRMAANEEPVDDPNDPKPTHYEVHNGDLLLKNPYRKPSSVHSNMGSALAALPNAAHGVYAAFADGSKLWLPTASGANGSRFSIMPPARAGEGYRSHHLDGNGIGWHDNYGSRSGLESDTQAVRAWLRRQESDGIVDTSEPFSDTSRYYAPHSHLKDGEPWFDLADMTHTAANADPNIAAFRTQGLQTQDHAPFLALADYLDENDQGNGYRSELATRIRQHAQRYGAWKPQQFSMRAVLRQAIRMAKDMAATEGHVGTPDIGKPAGCTCEYPTVVKKNGSGHGRGKDGKPCPHHREWLKHNVWGKEKGETAAKRDIDRLHGEWGEKVKHERPDQPVRLSRLKDRLRKRKKRYYTPPDNYSEGPSDVGSVSMAQLGEPTQFAAQRDRPISIAGANARINSGNHYELVKALREILNRSGLQPNKVYAAIHDVNGQARAAAVAEIMQQEYAQAGRYGAAWQGLIGHLPNLVLFHSHPQGTDSVYRLPFKGPQNAMSQLLDQAGIRSRVFIPHKEGSQVYIYDKERKLRPAVGDLATQLNLEVLEHTGYGEQHGGGDDLGRAAYRDDIHHVEGTPKQPPQQLQRPSQPVRFASPQNVAALAEGMRQNPEDRAPYGIAADALEEEGRSTTAAMLRQLAQSHETRGPGTNIPVVSAWHHPSIFHSLPNALPRVEWGQQTLRGHVNGLPLTVTPYRVRHYHQAHDEKMPNTHFMVMFPGSGGYSMHVQEATPFLHELEDHPPEAGEAISPQYAQRHQQLKQQFLDMTKPKQEPREMREMSESFSLRGRLKRAIRLHRPHGDADAILAAVKANGQGVSLDDIWKNYQTAVGSSDELHRIVSGLVESGKVQVFRMDEGAGKFSTRLYPAGAPLPNHKISRMDKYVEKVNEGYSQSEVAKQMGVSRQRISAAVRDAKKHKLLSREGKPIRCSQADHDAMTNAIHDSGPDNAPRLIYADMLEERGAPKIADILRTGKQSYVPYWHDESVRHLGTNQGGGVAGYTHANPRLHVAISPLWETGATIPSAYHVDAHVFHPEDSNSYQGTFDHVGSKIYHDPREVGELLNEVSTRYDNDPDHGRVYHDEAHNHLRQLLREHAESMPQQMRRLGKPVRMSHVPALYNAVSDNPHDDNGWGVTADALEEEGNGATAQLFRHISTLPGAEARIGRHGHPGAPAPISEAGNWRREQAHGRLALAHAGTVQGHVLGVPIELQRIRIATQPAEYYWAATLKRAGGGLGNPANEIFLHDEHGKAILNELTPGHPWSSAVRVEQEQKNKQAMLQNIASDESISQRRQTLEQPQQMQRFAMVEQQEQPEFAWAPTSSSWIEMLRPHQDSHGVDMKTKKSEKVYSYEGVDPDAWINAPSKGKYFWAMRGGARQRLAHAIRHRRTRKG